MTESAEDIRKSAEIDKLLSRANLHRMRTEYVEAEEACREALALDNTRLDVREMMADMLSARGKLEEAAAEYMSIVETPWTKAEKESKFETDAKRAAVETKYARIVLQLAQREDEKRLAKALLENPSLAVSTEPKRPMVSFLASALMPGLGQLYNGELVKGAIVAGAFMVSIIALAIAKSDMQNLLKSLEYSAKGSIKHAPPVSGIAILFMCIALFTWVYSVIDAPVSADKRRGKK